VSAVSVAVFASSFLIINSIQQDIVIETIHATDEVLLKKDINLKIVGTPDGERGRIQQDNSKIIINDSSFEVSDNLQISNKNNTNSTQHRIVINDSMSSTTPPEP